MGSKKDKPKDKKSWDRKLLEIGLIFGAAFIILYFLLQLMKG